MTLTYFLLPGPLPLDTAILGERAIQCRAYAKALHYKEEEFLKKPDSTVIEALISINNKLQQKEAANGLLEFVKEGEVQERWYEKLQVSKIMQICCGNFWRICKSL